MRWKPESPLFNRGWFRNTSIHLDRTGATSPHSATVNPPRDAVVEREFRIHQHTPQIGTRFTFDVATGKRHLGHWNNLKLVETTFRARDS